MKFTHSPIEQQRYGRHCSTFFTGLGTVFIAWQQILGPICTHSRSILIGVKGQKEVVEKVCNDEKITTCVAEVEGKVVGFVAYELNETLKLARFNCLPSS